ncbi:short chain dehydrogenase [Colletotrichum graminicola M1.001]|uniref:Short chain dehydrogenase n=1 Tax=Colletotrichum graminicola (strain M1.001 / M2 / FGSC 10212) TaxID=645133 RepID=E3Q941_COLGM|nr:short chain dehydrogenase [Colletotrichum graminicola M1.001]EFQ27220.1 short chain dehydrogenase [Colletotrichum graminicola M1.001]
MSSKRIVLITGANTGIGFETIRTLLQSKGPYHIIMESRSLDKGAVAISELEKEFPSTTSSLEVLQVDIVDDDSIVKAFQSIKDKHGVLDVLVNSAGASHDFNPQNYNPEDIKTLRQNFNKSYDVNTTGTHVITHPQGVPSAGWPKPFTGQAGYRSSKTALNMVMLNWHWLLKADGVKVWCISPGFLATGLGGNPEQLKEMGAGEPRQGGFLIKQAVEGERDADVGKVVNKDGIQSW